MLQDWLCVLSTGASGLKHGAQSGLPVPRELLKAPTTF